MDVSAEVKCEDSSGYKPFTDELTNILLADVRCEERVQRLLEGEESLAAERLIPQAERSKHGIFFTPNEIVHDLVLRFENEIFDGSTFFDPACGAGNLLLGIARRLNLEHTFDETVDAWSRRFGGCDIDAAFVRAVKLRLIFLAAYRHGLPEISENYLEILVSRFKHFSVGDYLSGNYGADFDCVIANPPFSHVVINGDCSWSSGRTQLAAVFIDKILQQGKPGQRLIAVLPDVLRSGTRYDRWRRSIEQRTKGGHATTYGRFTADVDVDVFFLDAISSTANDAAELISWIPERAAVDGRTKLGDLYNVSVGPVVPFRLTGEGEESPYITAKNCPADGEVSNTTKIRFTGRKVPTPFVVVRRTSNPSDRRRLITTLVTCSEPVAVENHLIVMRPKDQTLGSCRYLMERLRAEDAANQINEKIRCRHLTVRSIKDIDI